MSGNHCCCHGNLPPRGRYIRIVIDDEVIFVPVSDEVYAHFRGEFARRNPSDHQQLLYATVMKLMVAAYKEAIKRSPQR